jgi:hypothetical protein
LIEFSEIFLLVYHEHLSERIDPSEYLDEQILNIHEQWTQKNLVTSSPTYLRQHQMFEIKQSQHLYPYRKQYLEVFTL